jgi:hypothetical protein
MISDGCVGAGVGWEWVLLFKPPCQHRHASNHTLSPPPPSLSHVQVQKQEEALHKKKANGLEVLSVPLDDVAGGVVPAFEGAEAILPSRRLRAALVLACAARATAEGVGNEGGQLAARLQAELPRTAPAAADLLAQLAERGVSKSGGLSTADALAAEALQRLQGLGDYFAAALAPQPAPGSPAGLPVMLAAEWEAGPALKALRAGMAALTQGSAAVCGARLASVRALRRQLGAAGAPVLELLEDALSTRAQSSGDTATAGGHWYALPAAISAALTVVPMMAGLGHGDGRWTPVCSRKCTPVDTCEIACRIALGVARTSIQTKNLPDPIMCTHTTPGVLALPSPPPLTCCSVAEED